MLVVLNILTLPAGCGGSLMMSLKRQRSELEVFEF
jgi:hypothetical protein